MLKTKKKLTTEIIKNPPIILKKSIALGNPKDKINKTVTVTDIKTLTSPIGTISEIYMKDSKDNVIVWNASKFNSKIKVGNKINIYAKIKEIRKLKYDELTIVNYLLLT